MPSPISNMKRSYYNVAGIECEKVILRTKMDFSVGNAFKYIYRCNNVLPKGSFEEDLNKAVYSLENAIKYHTNKFAGKISVDKYINLLDSSAFSENLWNALVAILKGHADSMYIAEDMYVVAIECIKKELSGVTN